MPRKAKPEFINGYFGHLKTEYDVLRLVERFVEENSEPIITEESERWAKSEILLLQALCLYLQKHHQIKERSIYWLSYVLGKSVECTETPSELDKLFESLKNKDSCKMAYGKYLAFKERSYPIEKAVIVQTYEHIKEYEDFVKQSNEI